MELTGVYDEAYFNEGDRTTSLLFTRTAEGKKEIITQSSFYTFVYVDAIEYNMYKHKINHLIKKIEYVKDKVYLLDPQIELVKLYLKRADSIFFLRKIFNDVFESDVLFNNRLIIEHVDKLNPANHRVNYFDIETTSEAGFPDFMNPIERIISICAYDNYTNEPYLWIWHKDYDVETLRKEVTTEINNESKTLSLNTYRFSNENDMLNSFIDFIAQTQPDIITAWNILFDINYLCARAQYCNLDINKLSPLYKTIYANKLNLVSWRKGSGIAGKRVGRHTEQKHIKIVGLQWFDLLIGLKSIVAQEKPSWKLESIAREYLGVGKLATDFNIGEKWEADPKFIEDYNFIDAYLIYELDKKLGIINYYNEIKNGAFLSNINDVLASGKVLDNYVFKEFKHIYVLPSKKYTVTEQLGVGGAFVKEPSPGAWDYVAIFDFSGFYPGLMETFNLSADALVKYDLIHVNPKAQEVASVHELISAPTLHSYDAEKKEVTYFIRTRKFSANVTYNLGHKGVMIQAVVGLKAMRNNEKRTRDSFEVGTDVYKYHDVKQQSYKFIINAVWGVSAYKGFRLFSPINANMITAFARELNRYVANYVEQSGRKWLYSDTDSFMVCLQSNNYDDCIKETQYIENEIIKPAIDEFVRKYLPPEYAEKHVLEMEMEKIYSRYLLSDAKKRYIGKLMYYKGKPTEKIHYMGLDLKKSNTIKISKEAQYELAIAIINKEDVKPIIEKYYKLVTDSNDIDLFKIPSKLEKSAEEYGSNTPAVRGSTWSNANLKTNFHAGTKFYILWVTDCPTDVIAFDDEWELKQVNFKINKQKYFEDLHSKIDNLTRKIPEIKTINDTCLAIAQSKTESLDKWFK